ncbi:enoyl-CoA hydratase/isomerase family protein [Shimia sp.]|uniref:enoyl-CoA hydratase/isomerase family protein n=1 Tax=Shimia sp. TaxID=1954381 RepID=UPI003BAD6E8B
MSDRVFCETKILADGEPCFCIQMQAPRANALEPAFLADLHRAFDTLEQSGAQRALITGGRNFSTGGDVSRFLDAAMRGEAEAYAERVVPALQELVIRMLEMPVVIVSALRGATTGGSAGLLFASDLAVAAPDAFMQPYYGVMGFAPDGGWSALLPELIGVGPAQSWLMANHRQGVTELMRLGLVQAVDDTPEVRAMDLLAAVDTGAALASKALLWNDARRAAVRAGLSAETEAFRKLIGRKETLARMQKFFQPTG